MKTRSGKKNQSQAKETVPNEAKKVIEKAEGMVMDDPRPSSAPNCVKLQIVKGRNLKAMDRNILSKGPGTSDPFVEIALDGDFSKTSIKRRSLNPVWKEDFMLSIDEADSIIDFTVYDYDNLSAPDFMGSASLSVSRLSRTEALSFWLPLKAENDTNDLGEIEVLARWVHEPKRALHIPPDFFIKQANTIKPNSIRVCLLRAKRLPIMDQPGLLATKFLSQHNTGSSDPYIMLSIASPSHDQDEDHIQKQKSTVKKKELNPIWVETFTLKIEEIDDEFLHLEIFDHDILTASDKIGTIEVDLKTLVPGKITRAWHLIQLSEKSALKSKVELALQLVHDPSLELEIPPGLLDVKAYKHKPINELRILVIQARHLPIMDKNLFQKNGGSSDPYLQINFNGIQKQTKVIKRNLHPVWLELITIPLSSFNSIENQSISCDLYDYDTLSAPDFMGSVHNISLQDQTDRKVRRDWFTIDTNEAVKKKSKLELAFRFVHNPVYSVALPDLIDPEPSNAFVNELRIIIIRCHNLPSSATVLCNNTQGLATAARRRASAIMTPIINSAGKMQPYVVLQLGEESATSTIRRDGDLSNPVWLEAKNILMDSLNDTLQVSVKDATSKEHIGTVSIFDHPSDREIHRAWHPLTQNGRTACNGIALGSIEIATRLVHNPINALPVPCEFTEAFSHTTKTEEANQLSLCILRLRLFAIHNLQKAASLCIKARFCEDEYETQALRIGANNNSQGYTYLDVLRFAANVIEMKDQKLYIAATHIADTGLESTLGISILEDVSHLTDQQPQRLWCPIYSDETVIGRLEIAMRWTHNADRALTLPKATLRRALDPSLPPNELYVVFMRASRVPILSSNEIYQEQSVYGVVRLFAEERQTARLQRRELEPLLVWNQELSFPLGASFSANGNVEVSLFGKHQHDDEDELLGRIAIPLKRIQYGVPTREWYKLKNGLSNNSISGSVELYVCLGHSVSQAKVNNERQLRRQEKQDIKAADVLAAQPLTLIQETTESIDKYRSTIKKTNPNSRPANQMEIVVVRGKRLASGPRYRKEDKILKPIPSSYVSVALLGPKPGLAQFSAQRKRTTPEFLLSKDQTTTKSDQDRVPTWIETMRFDLPPAAAGTGKLSENYAIQLYSHDADADMPEIPTGQSDLIRLSDILLQTNKDSLAWRAWHDLKLNNATSGALDIWFRLVYDVNKVPEESLMDEVEFVPSKPINCCKVVIAAARVKTDAIKNPRRRIEPGADEDEEDVRHREQREDGYCAGGLRAQISVLGRNRITPLAVWDPDNDITRSRRMQTGYEYAHFKAKDKRYNFVSGSKLSWREDFVDITLYEQVESKKKVVGYAQIALRDFEDRAPRRKWFKLRRNLTHHNVFDESLFAEIDVTIRLTHDEQLAEMLPPAPEIVHEASCTAIDFPPPEAVQDSQSNEYQLSHDTSPNAVPRWFFLDAKTNRGDGPHTVASLLELWDSHAINNDTLVWRQGFERWTPIDQLAALKRILWDYPEPPIAYQRVTDENARCFVLVNDEHHPSKAALEEKNEEEEMLDVVDTLNGEEVNAIVSSDTIDQARGPYTSGELRDAIEAGRLAQDTLVWTDNSTTEDDHGEWIPLKKSSCVAKSIKRRDECFAEEIQIPDIALECELCGCIASHHCKDALALQLYEGEMDGSTERVFRKPKFSHFSSTQEDICTPDNVYEIVDGLVWIGTSSADYAPLEATHMIKISSSSIQQDAPLENELTHHIVKDHNATYDTKAMSDEFVSRFYDYDSAPESRSVQILRSDKESRSTLTKAIEDDLSDAVAPMSPNAPGTIPLSRRLRLLFSDYEDKQTMMSHLEDRAENLRGYIDNVTRTWDRRYPPRIIILADLPWYTVLIAAAYLGREHRLDSQDILQYMKGQLNGRVDIKGWYPPHGWLETLDEMLMKTALGRLFCEACFDDWRCSTALTVEAEASKFKTALRRLRSRDPTLQDLDLRDEGPLSTDASAALGAAAGHAMHLTALDVSGCALGDQGSIALFAALQHGTRGVGGETLAILRLAYNNIGDSGAMALAQFVSAGAEFVKRQVDQGAQFNDEDMNDISKKMMTSGLTPRLTSIDLSRNAIAEKGSRALGSALRRNTLLIDFNIDGNCLGDVGGAALVSALAVPDINEIQSVRAEKYRRLRDPRFQTNKNVYNDEIEFQARLEAAEYYNTSITNLHLADNKLSKESAQALATVFATNRVLKSIDLSTNPMLLTDDCDHSSEEILRFRQGRRSTYDNLFVGQSIASVLKKSEDDSIQATVAMKANIWTNLRLYNAGSLASVNLSRVPLTKYSLQKFAMWLISGDCNLVKLELVNINLNTRLAQVFAHAIAAGLMSSPDSGKRQKVFCPKLRHLDLSDNNFGPVGLIQLLSALTLGMRLPGSGENFGPLDYFSLSHCRIDPIGACALFAFLLNGNLSNLIDSFKNVLNHHQFTTDRATAWSLLVNYFDEKKKDTMGGKMTKRLEIENVLDLSHNDLGRIGIDALVAGLHLARLDDQPAPFVRLNLTNTRILSSGAISLATGLGAKDAVPRLNYLDLSTNSIQDSGCTALANILPKLPRLRYLGLAFNDLSGHSIFSLDTILRTTSHSDDTFKLLELHIDLNGNNVGDEGGRESMAPAPYLARSKVSFQMQPTTV